MKNICIIISMMLLVVLSSIILPDFLLVQETEAIDEYRCYLIDYADTTSFSSDLSGLRDIKQRKMLLIETLLPLVLKANEEILAQRTELLRIKKTSFYLTLQEIRFIEELAAFYKVEPGDHRVMLHELLSRVDILPPSLVLGQAAIESAWGTSRFAIEGNNVFGLRGSRGRGLVPKGRGPDETHTVRAFRNLQACINYYLWNINTNPEYEDLRQIRMQRHAHCNPIELAQGLKTYSEKGYTYVGDLVAMIRKNNLTMYDKYRLNAGNPYALTGRRSPVLFELALR